MEKKQSAAGSRCRTGVIEAGAALGNRLAAVDRDEEALTRYLWSAERGEPSCMFAAACWYRDGIGTTRDPVQAMRWYFTMLDHGNGDGLHEALELAKSGMTDEQIHEAARLAGRPGNAESTLHVLRSSRDAWRSATAPRSPCDSREALRRVSRKCRMHHPYDIDREITSRDVRTYTPVL